MKQNTINTFTGVMDLNSDPKFIAEGDYMKAYNLREGRVYGNQGSRSTLRSNSLVSTPAITGVNKCIGTAEDKLNHKLVYFINNDGGLHTIMQYNPHDPGGVNGTAEILLQSSVLGFDADRLISNGRIIRGQYLYWTDGDG